MLDPVRFSGADSGLGTVPDRGISRPVPKALRRVEKRCRFDARNVVKKWSQTLLCGAGISARDGSTAGDDCRSIRASQFATSPRLVRALFPSSFQNGKTPPQSGGLNGRNRRSLPLAGPDAKGCKCAPESRSDRVPKTVPTSTSVDVISVRWR